MEVAPGGAEKRCVQRWRHIRLGPVAPVMDRGRPGAFVWRLPSSKLCSTSLHMVFCWDFVLNRRLCLICAESRREKGPCDCPRCYLYTTIGATPISARLLYFTSSSVCSVKASRRDGRALVILFYQETASLASEQWFPAKKRPDATGVDRSTWMCHCCGPCSLPPALS